MHSFPLIDDRLVEDTLLLRRFLGQPVLKRSEPVVSPAEALGSVLCDASGRWRLWYNFFVARDPTVIPGRGCDTPIGYAESSDGIHWTLPDLDRVPLEGCAHRNIVLGPCQRDRHGRYLTGVGGLAGFVVVDAETTPHPRARGRFTAMYISSPRDVYGGICLAWSDDGIEWTAYAENPVIPGSQDTQNCLLWDPRLERYVCTMRPTIHCGPPEQHANRKMARCESEDLVHWSPSFMVLDADERDAPGLESFDEPGMGGNVRGRNWQFQGLTPFFLNDLYAGLTWSYDVCKGTFVSELLRSGDGFEWKREALREAFVADNRPEGFRGKLPIPIGSPPVQVADELFLYYSNTPYGHHEIAQADLDAKMANRDQMLTDVSLYLLGLKRDRWVGYEAGDREGELLARPFEWEGGGPLRLNLEVAAGGSVRVAFEDRWGRPIPDYHLNEIPPIEGPLDAVSHTLTFGPGPKTIVKLPPAGPVRLRLRLRRARLYGWDVQGPEDMASAPLKGSA